MKLMAVNSARVMPCRPAIQRARYDRTLQRDEPVIADWMAKSVRRRPCAWSGGRGWSRCWRCRRSGGMRRSTASSSASDSVPSSATRSQRPRLSCGWSAPPAGRSAARRCGRCRGPSTEISMMPRTGNSCASRLEDGGEAQNLALLDQFLQPGPHGGPGQLQRNREVGNRRPAVPPQRLDQVLIDLVHFGNIALSLW